MCVFSVNVAAAGRGALVISLIKLISYLEELKVIYNGESPSSRRARRSLPCAVSPQGRRGTWGRENVGIIAQKTLFLVIFMCIYCCGLLMSETGRQDGAGEYPEEIH